MASNGCDTRRFADVKSCPMKERGGQSAVVTLKGCLLRSRSYFPYFMLLALEAGSPGRALLLLLSTPVIWSVEHVFGCPNGALQILIFISVAGLRLSDVSGVSKAVLPKFFVEDMDSQCYQVLVSCSSRYVVTSFPRVMVEYFLKEHVGVNEVFGTELQVSAGGFCTGLVGKPPGVLCGQRKAETMRKVFGERGPDVGVGKAGGDVPFLSVCKEAYVVEVEGSAVSREQYQKALVFHDGRLVALPTPLVALTYVLWMPFGLMLALTRILITGLPMEVGFPCAALLGVRFRIKGSPPLPLPKGQKQGILFVCTHRTLLDATFLCVGLRRKVRALTYSVSRLAVLLSPIGTGYLTRDRQQDAHLIGQYLENEEDLFVCPEGTTCREPYLLRFSSLFAELTEHITPVAMRVCTSMFWGNTARGYKALDPFFYLMNPRPYYEIIFLDRLPKEQTVAGGKTSVEVAKMVQKQLAEALGYGCTEFTRKDKYTILAGHDGTVKDRRFMPKKPPATATACRGSSDDDKSF
ncbi:hypothetical protein GOP47_0010694 [Adiantum capillus-veneris]|uniref:Phospholipid/glycerol acyltransferase domain-containing protein n=1 Tax=Adiantum capillus-veneris TaxID=13818 RepID=A0A9D4UWB9_ADICA|nr:hypothetical protein GOP47_0010694 [Adiantum capillus-veneris]